VLHKGEVLSPVMGKLHQDLFDCCEVPVFFLSALAQLNLLNGTMIL